MAGDFSVLSHSRFFAGYLDAVGRHFTCVNRHCWLSVSVMPSNILDGRTIKSTKPVENPVREFGLDIPRFLNADPRNPLVFYLTEYFSWYKEFSNTCVCERLQLEGNGLSHDHIAYRLYVDHKHEVIFLASWNDR